ncbi:unnamed protein product [Nesidiocoris tenuis]|uniref:Uncharacterized protein n=1 Tax=Nesidiocoris tenuis TaxID=355587 RepID=A0A6H5GH44_9HEMI|nr:unnamed protein product [Nesidiocoris tenuis]
MTTPATGEIVLKVDRHAARHSRVHGPRPTSQRRDGLRATLITFGKVFKLRPPENDAPEDGRMPEGARAIIFSEIPKWVHEDRRKKSNREVRPLRMEDLLRTELDPLVSLQRVTGSWSHGACASELEPAGLEPAVGFYDGNLNCRTPWRGLGAASGPLLQLQSTSTPTIYT